jgi:hypothetical protein
MKTAAAMVTVATRTAPDPAQDVGIRGMPVNATAAAIASASAAVTLATRTAPDPTQGAKIVGVVLEASAVATKGVAASARGAEARAQGKMEAVVTTMVTAARMRAKETKEAAKAYPLRDAADHVTGATSGGINRETLSQARSCRA